MHRLTPPVWMFAAEAGGDGGEGGSGGGAEGGSGGGAGDGGEGQEGKDSTFNQADVDRIVADRLKRERETTKTKYADYDDLKKKAEGAKTAEERIAGLETQIKATEREALVRRIQAKHSVSDEDAGLFLTGADEDALTAQAKRLAERESERKKQGNHVAREGNQSAAKSSDEREFVRQLFGSGG